VLGFFARSVSNFQGAVLMSERAMTAEAGTLARACLESVLFMAAAATDAGFLNKLRDDHEVHRTLWILGLPADQQGCSPEQLEDLRRIAEDLTERPSIKMHKVAEATGLADLYRSVYAHLSSLVAPLIQKLERLSNMPTLMTQASGSG
jgi:hypothetical protein